MADETKNVKQTNIDANNGGLKWHSKAMLSLIGYGLLLLTALLGVFCYTVGWERVKIIVVVAACIGAGYVLLKYVVFELVIHAGMMLGKFWYYWPTNPRNEYEIAENGSAVTYDRVRKQWDAHVVKAIQEGHTYREAEHIATQAVPQLQQMKPPPGTSVLLPHIQQAMRNGNNGTGNGSNGNGSA